MTADNRLLMRTIFKSHHSRSLVANTTHIFTNLPRFAPPRHPLFALTLLGVCACLTPVTTYAALPDTIQTALNRADLMPTDISIVITPVGDKNTSRLPPIVQVIDSGNPDVKTKDIKTTAVTIKKDNIPKNAGNQAAPLMVSKQEIEQEERQLQAYTDDPYTHQSLGSTPTLLPMNPNNSNAATLDGRMTAVKSTSPLLSHQPNTARTPASTMKLIPSFIALDTLGADFVWHTRVYHSGIIIGEHLYGNLVIQGSGDPKMTHERLQQLLYQVQKTGIRHIDGDIIIDSSVFSNVSKDPAAFDNAPLRPYNASPDGFLVNFSSVGIKSKPLENGQARLTYTPQLANYQLPNIVNTRTAACSQANRSLAPDWQANKLTLNAELPTSCGEHVFYVAYPDAKDFAARVVTAKWQQLGNTISGNVITQERPYQAGKSKQIMYGLAALPLSPLPLVSYPSFNLAQQIYDINHFSNNVMTEQVALSIGAYDKTNITHAHSSNATSLYQFGQPTATDYPAALQTINQWWQTHLTTPPPYLTNGSGLCRDCTLSAANLSELLTYAYSQPSFDAYVHSLGVAGVSGTIMAHGARLPNSAAIGRAWIKTGTLNNVTAMAGYVKGQSGQDYTVVGLINTEQALNPYIARPVLDAMLDWTAQQ